jgi:hypothetical protein
MSAVDVVSAAILTKPCVRRPSDRRIIARAFTIAASFVLFATPLPRIEAQQVVPPDLAELTTKARLSGTILSSCAAEFTPGRKGAFAVASQSPDGNRRYMALDADGTMWELAWFKGAGDLACYTRAEAEKLADTLAHSATVHGAIEPQFDSTVVCTFVDETTALCWQYSPTARDFVLVGKWTT